MNAKLKRMLGAGVLVCSLSLLSIPTITTAEATQFPKHFFSEDISTRYIGMRMFYAELNISSTGLSTSAGTIETRTGYTCDVTLELQRDSGSSWISIKEWEDGGKSISFKENWYVTSGHDYRVKLSADVYDSSNRLVESLTTYSAVVEY